MIKIFSFSGRHNSNNTNYQFWQQDNHPILLDSTEKLGRALEYIHQNPVKGGFVDVPEEFLWSSARDYSGKPGIIPLVYL